VDFKRIFKGETAKKGISIVIDNLVEMENVGT